MSNAEVNPAVTPDSNGVHWTPPVDGGDLGTNFGLVCVEYLIYVGMAGAQNQMQNNMNYDNAMQPGQSDLISWFAYLNNLESQAKSEYSSGQATPSSIQKIAQELAKAFKQFFGNSQLPTSASGWSLSAQPGQAGYIDPNSDFGKWMKALWTANTNSSGQYINGWTGFGGDASVTTVTNQLDDLNVNIQDQNGNGGQTTLLYDLTHFSAGNSGALDGDMDWMSSDYYMNKQGGSHNPVDTLTNLVTDSDASNSILRGIGTQQTAMLQQLSTTLNGLQNNGNSIIQSISTLYSAFNQHMGQAG